MATRRQTWARTKDLIGVAGVATAWVATGMLSQDRLPLLARWLGDAALRAQPRTTAERIAAIEHLLRGRITDLSPRDLYREHLARRYEHLLGRVLDMHGRGWQPDVELVGAPHVAEALAAGHGVILWVMSFCGHLIPKLGLHRGGFPIVHLSRANHGGFSGSWVAVHVLNRWAQKAENRHLAERVVIPDAWSLDHLRTLKRRLARNAVVSIAGEHAGEQPVVATVLGRRSLFAKGAPALARSTGASLLTLRSHRRGPNQYTVVVDPPITVDTTTKSRDGLVSAVQTFAHRLECQIIDHAADWDRWSAYDFENGRALERLAVLESGRRQDLHGAD